MFKLCKTRFSIARRAENRLQHSIFSPEFVHKSNSFAAVIMWICYNKSSFQMVNFGKKCYKSFKQ